MSKVVNMVGGGGSTGFLASIFATGVSQTDTVTLTTPSGEIKNGEWVSVVSSRLPDEYKEVDCIISDGTQLFKTGYTPSSSPYLKIKFNLRTLDAVSNGYFYGAGSNNSRWCSFEYFTSSAYWNVGGSTAKGQHAMSPNVEYSYTVTYNNGNFVVSGATGVSETYTGELGSGELVFFGSATDGSNPSIFALLPTQIYAGADFALIRDYVPCYRISDGVAGMYDLVNQTFTTSSGTSEFIKGEDKADEGGFLFSDLNELGTYTLTANNGAKTATENILVDAATNFEVNIEYVDYLYKLGDECEDVTGGYIDGKYITESTYSFGEVRKNADNLYCASTGGLTTAGLSTFNKIDLSGYTKIFFEVVDFYKEYAVRFSINPDTRYNAGSNGHNTDIGSLGTFEVDISNYNGEYYVGFGVWGYTNRLAISKIWLE